MGKFNIMVVASNSGWQQQNRCKCKCKANKNYYNISMNYILGCRMLFVGYMLQFQEQNFVLDSPRQNFVHTDVAGQHSFAGIATYNMLTNKSAQKLKIYVYMLYLAEPDVLILQKISFVYPFILVCFILVGNGYCDHGTILSVVQSCHHFIGYKCRGTVKLCGIILFRFFFGMFSVACITFLAGWLLHQV